MHADKKYGGRGLEGARRATAMPVDESPKAPPHPDRP